MEEDAVAAGVAEVLQLECKYLDLEEIRKYLFLPKSLKK
jgi:hypothetical protein